jgi:hypothetical protein
MPILYYLSSPADWQRNHHRGGDHTLVDDEPETKEERAAVESPLNDPSPGIPLER